MNHVNLKNTKFFNTLFKHKTLVATKVHYTLSLLILVKCFKILQLNTNKMQC